jgi:hypothetical protein
MTTPWCSGPRPAGSCEGNIVLARSPIMDPEIGGGACPESREFGRRSTVNSRRRYRRFRCSGCLGVGVSVKCGDELGHLLVALDAAE